MDHRYVLRLFASEYPGGQFASLYSLLIVGPIVGPPNRPVVKTVIMNAVCAEIAG